MASNFSFSIQEPMIVDPRNCITYADYILLCHKWGQPAITEEEFNKLPHFAGIDTTYINPALTTAALAATIPDLINRPPHYTSHPSGIECIQITEHMGYNLGNAIKYIWRADLKGNSVDDLAKARWYITREMERLNTKKGD